MTRPPVPSRRSRRGPTLPSAAAAAPGMVLILLLGMLLAGCSSSAEPGRGASAAGATRTSAPGPSPLLPGASAFVDSTPVPGTTVSLCPAPAEPTSFTAVSFNIHSGWSGGRVDLEAVAAAIEASAADVVLLQEVDRFRERSGGVHQARWLGRRLGMKWAYGPATRYAPSVSGAPPGRIGNAVLSRFPILEQRNLRLPREPGLYARRALRAVVAVPNGERLSVYSTHLDHTSGAVRIRQAARLRAAVDADPYPVLVGGDLNAEPGSPALNVLRRTGLGDAWESEGDGPGLTVPAGIPRRRIDYLLPGPELRTTSVSVIHSGASDHREVRAEFEFPVLVDC